MLRGIRKASANWLGRAAMAVILGLIAISFAIWGIGDIFRGFGRSTVAKVGSTEISVDQFRQIYNDRLQQLSRELGRPVTPDQARALRLEEQLAGQLVAEAALDQRARQLRLNVSDAEIARQITNDPSFKGPSGQFDRARFEQIIRGAGYTEARFAAEQKRLTLRREIAQTVSGEMMLPKTMADALNRYENEQRAIDYLVLDGAKAGDIAAPTPEVIAKYFEDHKAEFRAPEYRTIVVMSVAPADLAKAAEVSDADAKRYYDNNLARFGTPELKRRIARDRARGELAAGHDKIEDERAAGLRLTEVAQKLGLTARTIEAVDRQGRDPDGNQITGMPAVDVIGSAFRSDMGVENEPMQMPGGGYVWFEVAGVKPSRERNLDEVRARVEEKWREDQISERLKAKAAGMVDKLKAGSALNDVAAAEGLAVQTTFGLKRAGNAASMPPSVIEAVFASAKDEAGSAQGKDATERVVFRLTDITVPSFDAATSEGKRIEEST